MAVVCLVGCAADDPNDNAGGSESAVSVAAPQLGKHYAGMLRSTVDVRFDDGRTEKFVTTVRGFITFDTSNGDDAVRLRLKACRFELPAFDGFGVAVADDVLQRAIPEFVLDARIAKKGDRTTFTTNETVILLGLRGVAASGALPTDPTDARVIDQDGDGQPAFSIKGTKGPISGRIFAGFRASVSGEGDIGPDGAITARGLLRYNFKDDVAFYGDSIPVVDAAAIAREAVAKMTPGAPGSEKQEFRLVRLSDDAFDGTSAMCAAVASSGLR